MAVKFPKVLGSCIDKLYLMRAERLEVQREMEARVEKLKADEKAMREHILASFDKSKIEGAKGEVATASIKRSDIPQVKDWDKFYAYIDDNKAFDLLERRVSKSGYQARIDEGEDVPGVEVFTVLDLSLTKSTK